jgi:hypothetical protein
MTEVKLTARELHVLKTIVLLEIEERENYLDVSLKTLYGKLNVLWAE